MCAKASPRMCRGFSVVFGTYVGTALQSVCRVVLDRAQRTRSLWKNSLSRGLFSRRLTNTSSAVNSQGDFDFDFVVIGGGSGGLAAAKEAAGLGARTALIDFVNPTARGTRWGLGGTCVNAGCIPKKLFHAAALQRQWHRNAAAYGIGDGTEPPVDWEVLRNNITSHVRSLNWGYKTQLRAAEIRHVNAHASLVDAHTISCTDARGNISEITAKYICVAVGGRPAVPDIPGAEHCVTSDDLFALERPPGKTLVVGASYVALECAGFLQGIEQPTTLMVRSVFLRGFDRQMAEMIGGYIEEEGVRVLRPCEPRAVRRTDDGRLAVTYACGGRAEETETFDTVFVAVGRRTATRAANLHGAGVALNPRNDKVIVNERDQTSVPNIYAIGDCIDGGVELTPIASRAGKLLARRLFGGGSELMDYKNVPTAVFTPLEYGTIGLSEEAAEAKFGKKDIEVYHAFFDPLEFSLPGHAPGKCYMKLVCVRSKGEAVVGLHYFGPNAGEITQGFAIALRMGVRKKDFDQTPGIHPTCAEDFTTLNVTKSSLGDPHKSGC